MARYPRPESDDAPKKKVAAAPSTPTKKKTEVASTKSTKGSTTAKTSKSDPKATASSKTTAKKPTATKPVVASTTRKKESVSEKTAKAKESIAEAKSTVKSVKEDAKKNLGELARDLHAPATNSSSQKSTVAAAVTPKQPKLNSSEAALLAPVPPTNVSAQVPTITVNANPNESARLAASVNVPSVITQADKLPSHVISSGMMPLAMPPSAPSNPAAAAPAVASTETDMLKEAVTAPPKAHTLNPLPIEEFPADDDDTARAAKLLASSGGSNAPVEKPKATVKEPAKPAVVETPKEPVTIAAVEETPAPARIAVAEEPAPLSKPTLALPPMVKPSMNSVRTASFKPSAPSASSPAPVIDSGTDFTPGGATFDEPPKPKAAPSVTLSPSLGTMTIDAERADSENSKNLVTFNGNVRIDCKRFQMKADKVVSHLREAGSGGGVEKVVSDGNVTVKMLGTDGPGYVASGSHAIYDPIKETILLTGWPKIEEGNKALVASSAATEILIDTKTSRLTTNGSTKTVIRQ